METIARPRRADAERNRRRLLDAAAELFAERGIDVGVAEIARRAGVGQGTLFRHFPSKQDLVAAIALERMGHMVDVATALQAEGDPHGLLTFMQRMIEEHIGDRLLFEAIGCAVALEPELQRAQERMERSIGALLRQAQEAGTVRDDITAIDVVMVVKGVFAALEPYNEVAPKLWRRYTTLAFDALRPASATALPGRPPTAAQRRQALEAMATQAE